MNRYNPTSQCVKCGSFGASTQHSTIRGCTDKTEFLLGVPKKNYETIGVMIRRCHICGYGWHELPLDATTEAA